MKRRDFLAAGLGTTAYSVVRARRRTESAAPPLATPAKPAFETIRAERPKTRRIRERAAHDAGEVGDRPFHRGRRTGRRSARRSRRRGTGEGGAGAGPFAAGRQLVERSEDARRRGEQPQRPSRLARGRAHRRVPPRRRRQQPAALLRSCGTCCSTTKWSASRTSPCCWKPCLYSAATKDGRITQRDGALRQDASISTKSAPKCICDCTGDSRLGLEAGADDALRSRGAHRIPTKRSRRWSPTRKRSGPASCSLRASTTSRCRSRRRSGRARSAKSNWCTRHDRHLGVRLLVDRMGRPAQDDPRQRAHPLRTAVDRDGRVGLHQKQRRHPDSRNWAMDWVGMMPGKRGSRRLLGDHVLTQQDLMGSAATFDDAVAIGGWPMDEHPPGGFDRVRLAAPRRRSRRRGLQHSAALALQPQHRQPVDGGPQHQREPRGVHFDARDGHVRGDRPGGGHGGGALHPARPRAPADLAREGAKVEELHKNSASATINPSRTQERRSA